MVHSIIYSYLQYTACLKSVTGRLKRIRQCLIRATMDAHVGDVVYSSGELYLPNSKNI